MVTPEGFDRFAASADPAAVVAAARRRAEQAAEAREKLRGLTGRASSDDGFITAEVDDTGPTGLTLEPKAVRKAAADLAAEILETMQRARADFERRRREVLGSLDELPRPDLDHARAQLAEMQAAFGAGTADLLAVFERMQARFRT